MMLEKELREENNVKEQSINETFEKDVYEKPKYKILKPLFSNSYTTTVSATSQKR